MKRIIAILLVLLLVVSMCACGSGSSDTKPEDKPAQEDTGKDTTPAPADDKTDDEEPAEEPAEETPAEETPADVVERVGYYDDPVDHFARDPYKFCYCYTGPGALNDNMIDVFKRLGKLYNFELDEMNANNSADNYVQGVEVEYNKGVDGLFIDCDPTYQARVVELTEELGLPYVLLFNYLTDENGVNLAPSVVIDQSRSGRDTIQWYADRYKEYWGDIDMKDLCLLNLNYSTNPAFVERVQGSTEQFQKVFPGAAILEVDGVSTGAMNAEAGYDITSQTISAHPEYKYWIIFACVEYYAQGACRYVETTDHPENFLITNSGSNCLPLEFEAGYDGTSWKVCYAVSDINYGGPAAMGLIAICDGRATEESLWQELRAEGDKCTLYVVDAVMVTKDNWSNFKDEVWALYDPEGKTTPAE